MHTSPDEPLDRGWQPPARSGDDHEPDADLTPPGVVQRATALGLLIGLAAGLVVAGLMSIDYLAWKDVPVEQAVVTSQEISSTERVACGRALWPNTAARTTTFTVDQPRAGFPATFSVVGCGLGVQVGQTTLLQRMPGTTEDDLMLGGKLTVAAFAEVGGTTAGIGFAAAFLWVQVVATVRPRWRRWVAAGRTQAE